MEFLKNKNNPSEMGFSPIAKNTGEGVEPVVGAHGYDHDPTYVLDG